MAVDTTLVRATTFAASITAGVGGIDTDETLVIGGKTYTFKASYSNTDGHVTIGAAIDDTLKNLVDAINVGSGITEVGSGSGVGYAAAMTRNPCFYAAQSAGRIDVYALVPGSVGNVFPVAAGTSAVTWDSATAAGGSGNIGDYFDGFVVMNQLNSEVLAALAVFTAKTD